MKGNKFNEMNLFIKIIEVSSLILCLFGIIGNILSIIICSRKPLKKQPTFIFMASMSFMNILPLITILSCPIAAHFMKFENHLQIYFCKISTFLTYWGSEASTYLLVYKYNKVFCILI